jgi:hypothetical protein
VGAFVGALEEDQEDHVCGFFEELGDSFGLDDRIEGGEEFGSSSSRRKYAPNVG